MKFLLISLATLCFGAHAALAQAIAYSKPSGFVTHAVKAGQFNLIGLTLHEPVVISGVFDDVSGNELTDEDENFTTALQAGKTYILEITENATSPSLVGAIQELTGGWTSNTLTTSDNLEEAGLAAGAKYQLRAARTISQIFGANNEAGLQGSANKDIDEADVIYIPNGVDFDQYFYSSSTAEGAEPGWYKSGETPILANDTPVIYTDALLIYRRGNSDLDFTMHGCVKSTAATMALTGGEFNYVSTVFPVGATLGNSGLEASLEGSDNYSINEADVVYMPDGEGGYNRYFYSNPAGDEKWCSDKFDDASNVPLKSGIIIQRRTDHKNATITPPALYSNL